MSTRREFFRKAEGYGEFGGGSILLIAVALLGPVGYVARAQAAPGGSWHAQESCKALQSADFSAVPDAPTLVSSATSMPAAADLPAYCEVRGYITTSIGIEMALPVSWNGKFLEGGCGAHCGVLDEVFAWSCQTALRKGYACIISDMGHKGTGSDGIWASHNLQAKMDWAYRATHVVALVGKALAERFYHQAPTKSYFAGCSTGGRQALQEAQRFPRDFDGIIAGAPPVDLSSVYMTLAWGIRAVHDAAGKPLLGASELKLLTDAAVARCDPDDGTRDGIIADPLHCRFDPASLACGGNNQTACLSSTQIEAVRKVYAGPVDSSGKALSLGGPLPGSEYSWNQVYVGVAGEPPAYEQLVLNGLRYLFLWFEPDPSWQLTDFDFDRDSRRLGLMEVLYDSSNPDLRRFKAAGGKMIIYQGGNDVAVLPRTTVDYYETVERTMGGAAATRDFLRLFVLPGVEHCEGGPGADVIDYLGYLDDWVERGHAPGELLAAHVEGHDLLHPAKFPLDPKAVKFTRSVYPYPARALYGRPGEKKGAGKFGPDRALKSP
jgi:hypothetical protein